MSIKFIQHSAKGTTWSKKDHKYIAKVTSKNGKVYYKYNSKTQKYDQVKISKEDMIPQTPEEEAKFYMNQLIGGLESAQRKLLSSKGIIADDSAYNHMLITDKNFAAKQNTKARRAKHSDEDEAYLEHHGIEGQKWGERNGPPYPLDANKATQAKKKAAAADKPYAKKDYNKVRESGDKIKKVAGNTSKEKLTFKERRAQMLERKAAKAEERAAYQKRLSDARQRAVKAREAERSAKQKAADAERKEKEKLIAEKQKAKEAKEKEKAAKNQKPEVKQQPQKEVVVKTQIQQPQQNQNANNQQQNQQRPSTMTEEKQAILDSKNPLLLYQNKDKFTDQEFSVALNRLRNEQQLRDIVNKPVPSKTKQFVEEYSDKINTAKTFYDSTKTAIKIATDVATIFGMGDNPVVKGLAKAADTKNIFEKDKPKKQEEDDSKKATQQTQQKTEQQFKQTVEKAAKSFNDKASTFTSKDDIIDVFYRDVTPSEQNLLALPVNQFLLEDKKFKHSDLDDLDELYLEHHGIQGQKWGERNGPPYPLDANKSAQAQKKAAAADKPYAKKDYNQSSHHFVKSAGGKSGDKKEDKNNGVEEYKKLTKEQKLKKVDHSKPNASITAWGGTAFIAAANAALLAIGVINPIALFSLPITFASAVSTSVNEAKEFKQEKADDKYRQQHEQKDPNTGMYLKNPPKTSLAEDVAKVNPSYNVPGENFKQNCMLCSVAFDLRMKGYDVRAAKASEGYYISEVKDWYPGAKINKINNVDDKTEKEYLMSVMKHSDKDVKDAWDKTTKNLSKDKNSHGFFNVDWNGGYGSGHSMQYQVDSNGKVTLIDCQSNKIYTKQEDLTKILSRTTLNFETVRVDNLKIDEDFRKKLVR